MKSVAYHRLAESDMVESAAFYEGRRTFLGERFLDALEEMAAKIQKNPDFGKPGKFHTRSWRVRRFPFRIVYLVQTDRIWIVAVAHLSRKPDYWIERMN